jgi:hypothetical protein
MPHAMTDYGLVTLAPTGVVLILVCGFTGSLPGGFRTMISP